MDPGTADLLAQTRTWSGLFLCSSHGGSLVGTDGHRVPTSDALQVKFHQEPRCFTHDERFHGTDRSRSRRVSAQPSRSEPAGPVPEVVPWMETLDQRRCLLLPTCVTNCVSAEGFPAVRSLLSVLMRVGDLTRISSASASTSPQSHRIRMNFKTTNNNNKTMKAAAVVLPF